MYSFVWNQSIDDCSLSPLVIARDSKIGDVSGGNDYMNIHTLSQQNGLSSLINTNNSDNSEMNGDFNNGDVSCRHGFINSHNLSQCN